MFGGKFALHQMFMFYCSWSSPLFRPGANYESKLPLKIGI